MTECDRLKEMLEEVKYKIGILDAIEKRLLNMRGLVIKSMDLEILEAERQAIQLEIDSLFDEIKLLEKDPTLKS